MKKVTWFLGFSHDGMMVSRILFLGAVSFFPFSFLSLGSSFLGCGGVGAAAGVWAGAGAAGDGMAMGGGAWPGVKKVGGAWRRGQGESYNRGRARERRTRLLGAAQGAEAVQPGAPP